MRPVLWFACALFCLTSVARLAAQDAEPPFGEHHRSAKHTIRGNLRDAATNRGVDGVKVELREAGGAPVSTTFTSNSGEFTFAGIGSGTYEVSVLEVGYQPIDQQISVEDSALGLQLSLRKADESSNGSRSPTVSVRELSIPRKAHADMLKGVDLLYQKSDYRGSISEFERATKEYPGYYEAFGQMAIAYLDLGETVNAEDALKKSIDASQQHYSDAYFALAGLYVDAKRFEDAEPLARKGAELDDMSWKGHFELASALYGLNRAEEAEPEAKAAAQRQPDDPEAQLLLANIHIRLKNYPAVLEDLDAYLKLAPNGQNAEQARHLREQIQTALQAPQPEADAEDSCDSDGADDTPAENAPGDPLPEPALDSR